MADFKPPAGRSGTFPSVLGQIGAPADLPRGNHSLGFQSGVLKRNTTVVERSADYLDARRRQADSYASLIDARMRITRKLAELVDLPNVIAEDQRVREHARWQAERSRSTARRDAEHDHRLAAVRKEAQLASVQEITVRAQRNLEAAERVKDAQLDQWYAEAQARTNNARAEFQDTAADLARAPGATAPAAKDAPEEQKARDLALLDQQIELERGRGNQAAVLALLNLKALLRGS